MPLMFGALQLRLQHEYTVIFAIAKQGTDISIVVLYYFLQRKKGSGTLDNVNESVKYIRSLDGNRRKKELKRLTEENHKIQQRIDDVKGTYSRVNWDQEAERKDALLRRTCEYPPPLLAERKRKEGERSRNGESMYEDDEYSYDYEESRRVQFERGW
jgi:cell division protein FtsB